jgi:hypothetical protein
LPSAGSELAKADVSVPAELRLFFQEWAKRLREGLDAVRAPTEVGAAKP